MPAKFELVRPDGSKLELTHPYRLRELAGIGMSPVEHNIQRAPFQDGATYLASFLRPRVVTFSLALVDWSSELAVWDARDAMLSIVSALADGFGLLATLPSGAERRLDLRFADDLDMPIAWRNWTLHQPTVMQAIAHQPLWYDPTSVNWTYMFDPGLGDWIFPLPFPRGFGSYDIGIEETKDYEGTFKAYPIITIGGPITNLVILNETTDEQLDFTGYTVADARVMTIDLTPGVKTVLLDDDTNLIDKLTDDSDLATWHIAADPEATDGQNTMVVSGTGADPGTFIQIRFFTKYIGI